MAKAKPVESILGISPAKAAELLLVLTPRERQVVDLMATGEKNRKIAEKLGISPKTLDIHRLVAKRKLGSRTIADIVRVVYAEKFGKFLS